MLTQLELKKWQEEMFQLAKEVMQRDGYHIPLVILATEKRLMQAAKRGNLKVITTDQLLKFKSFEEFEKNKRTVEEADLKEISDDKQTVFITVPLSYTNQDRLAMLVDMVEESKQEEFKALIQSFLARGNRMDVDDPMLRVGNAVLKAMNLHEKDIHAHVIMKAIKATGAYAFIKIDEMWYKKSELEQGKDFAGDDIKKRYQEAAKHFANKGLEEDPEAEEGLGIMLETAESTRLLFVSVNKEEGRNSESKVLSFGPTEEIESAHDGGELQGRFVDLLRKAETLEPPEAKA